MDYKKFFKSQKLRFFILQILSFVPDKTMLEWQYRLKLNRSLNWKKPERFTEFLQKYKAQYRNPLLPTCVDKLAVKDYVANKGLKDIIIPTLGVYDRSNQIDFNSLPESFVLKTTNGGGGENVIICRNKKDLKIEETCKNLDSWLKLKTVDAGREWAYTGLTNPKIIAEELLINPSNPDAGLEDFKILCFNGKPEIVIYDCDRYIGHKRNFYDINWNQLNVTSDCPGKNEKVEPPNNLDAMLEVASKLSKDFPFVRVDLYNIEGKIYFGELTFYPWSGYVQFNPDSFDFKLGKLFKEAWKNKEGQYLQ